MKKTLLASLIATPLIFGCVSTDDKSAGSIDRAKVIKELTTQMDDLGYESVKIQPGVDEFLNISAAILKRQRNVMEEYRQLRVNHTDVQAFLYASSGKSDEELKQAIAKFDADITNDGDKIAHKITAYNSANETIYDSNVELAGDLTVEIAKSAYILSQHGTAVAKATALNATSSLFSSFSSDDEKKDDTKDLGSALIKAKDQLSLAMDANEIISIEQDTIKQIEQLQAEHEAKGKKL
ncbi:hypothetical protein D5R81_04735 [Parashewanella spongiae]|uniref:Lipoprotein n=1 Tax=Parashewanella spongiae TaxID=342950 RepID=A0A3A6U3B4_9GAMM|nr:hypothetical protein [Parashewanella spongiae]MCL1077297.1 hypothetical protein [Parashewanella spongiae]RJY18525.1 hypothetical protein D5R81_04735 [Parashewanella spongiae]